MPGDMHTGNQGVRQCAVGANRRATQAGRAVRAAWVVVRCTKLVLPSGGCLSASAFMHRERADGESGRAKGMLCSTYQNMGAARRHPQRQAMRHQGLLASLAWIASITPGGTYDASCPAVQGGHTQTNTTPAAAVLLLSVAFMQSHAPSEALPSPNRSVLGRPRVPQSV